MSDESQRQIFIQNIPYSVNESDLAHWCMGFGPITKCSLKCDKNGNSRGFAFVTYATMKGPDNILSQGPHFCSGRQLRVRTANGHQNFNEDQYDNSPSDYPSQDTSTNEYFELNPMENNPMYDEDDDSHNQLASLRDELDANLECMDIDHKHQVKVLREKLAREKKLRDQAEELYKEAEEEYRNIQEEHLKLRTTLIKNVMQTFNIRRDFARRTKDQWQKCHQLEQQFQDNPSSDLSISKKSNIV